MKKRLATKSKELNCDLFKGSASSPHSKIGTHLVFMRWITTSSEAMRSTKNLFLLHYRSLSSPSSLIVMFICSMTINSNRQKDNMKQEIKSM